MLGLGTSISKSSSIEDGYPANAFVFTVKTDNAGHADRSNDDQFSLPVQASSPSNVNNFTRPLIDVDWGDGTQTIDLGKDSDVTEDTLARTFTRSTHTYATAGTYTITITPATNYAGSGHDTAGAPPMRNWDFGGAKDDTKMVEILNWGLFPSGGTFTFYGCSNMTISATDNAKFGFDGLGTDYSGVVSLSGQFAFRGCSSITTIGNWNFEKLTSARRFMDGSTNWNQDITYWYLGKNSSDGSVHTNFGNISNDCQNMFANTSFNGDGLWNNNFAKVVTFSTFLSGTSLTDANYDLILTNWGDSGAPAQTSTNTVTFPATRSETGASEAGYDVLIAGNWAGIVDEN